MGICDSYGGRDFEGIFFGLDLHLIFLLSWIWVGDFEIDELAKVRVYGPWSWQFSPQISSSTGEEDGHE
jgi:hypothetical protein